MTSDKTTTADRKLEDDYKPVFNKETCAFEMAELKLKTEVKV